MWKNELSTKTTPTLRTNLKKVPTKPNKPTCKELYLEAIEEIKQFISNWNCDDKNYSQGRWEKGPTSKEKSYLHVGGESFAVEVIYYTAIKDEQMWDGEYTDEYYCALLNSEAKYNFGQRHRIDPGKDKIHAIYPDAINYGKWSSGMISYFVQFHPVGRKPRGYGTKVKEFVEWDLVEEINRILESKRNRL